MSELIVRNYSGMHGISQISNNRIVLNEFKIKKTVDVKRLKHQLWENLDPKLEDQNKEKEVTLASLMDELYYEKTIINPNNVSVHSAFICMLHLANEKELKFEAREDNANSDFKISR